MASKSSKANQAAELSPMAEAIQENEPKQVRVHMLGGTDLDQKINAWLEAEKVQLVSASVAFYPSGGYFVALLVYVP